jgi:hypothetical protein
MIAPEQRRFASGRAGGDLRSTGLTLRGCGPVLQFRAEIRCRGL